MSGNPTMTPPLEMQVAAFAEQRKAMESQYMTEPKAEQLAGVVDAYPAFTRAKWYGIVHRGGFAFRFGPFEGPEIGKIIEQCIDEKIPLLVTADCGTPFDWNVARDMRGYPDGESESDGPDNDQAEVAKPTSATEGS